MRTKLETKRVKTVTSLLSWMGGWDGWYRRRSVLLTATHPVPSIVFLELWNLLNQSPEMIRTCVPVFILVIYLCTYIHETRHLSFFPSFYSFEKGLSCQGHACMYNHFAMMLMTGLNQPEKPDVYFKSDNPNFFYYWGHDIQQ